MNKFFVLILLLLTALNLYSADYTEIKYKSSNEIDWSDDIPGNASSVIALVDGVEIETAVLSVSGSTKKVDLEWFWGYEDADSFSYRLNKGEWKIIDGEKRSVTIDNLQTGQFNLFEIYATKDGKASNISSYGVVANSEKPYRYPVSLRLSVSPYSLAIYDFYNGHHIQSSKYLSYSRYGLAADADFGLYVLDRIRFSFGAGYSYIHKDETIIPEAFDVQYLKAFGGLDITAIRKGSFSASLGAFGGMMMHINADKYNWTSFAGARLDLSYALSNHFAVSAGTRFSAAHLPSAEYLLNSMTYLIEPVAISVEVRF